MALAHTAWWNPLKTNICFLENLLSLYVVLIVLTGQTGTKWGIRDQCLTQWVPSQGPLCVPALFPRQCGHKNTTSSHTGLYIYANPDNASTENCATHNSFQGCFLGNLPKVIFIWNTCYRWITLKASTSLVITSFHDFMKIQNVTSLVEHSDRSFAAITRCGSSGGSCGPARHASGPSGLAWHTMPCIFLTAVLQNFRWFARYFKTWLHRNNFAGQIGHFKPLQKVGGS